MARALTKADTYPVLVDLVQEMRVNGIEEFHGLCVAIHCGEMQGVPAVVVAMQESASIEEELDHPRVT